MRSAASIFLVLAAALPAAAQDMTILAQDTPPTTGVAPGGVNQLILHLRVTDANGGPRDYTFNSFQVTLSSSLGTPANAYKLFSRVKLYNESSGWNVAGTFDPAVDPLIDTVEAPELASNTVRLDWNMGTFQAPTRAFRDCYVVVDLASAVDAATGELTDNVTFDVQYVNGSQLFTNGGAGVPATFSYDPDSSGTRFVDVGASRYAMVVPSSAFTDFAFALTLRAEDANGNRDKDYDSGKTANLSASLGAVSPASVTGFSLGLRTDNVQLTTAGSVTITATDSATPGITATSSAISVKAERTWRGTVNSDWSNTFNWEPNAVPVNRPAVIDKTGSFNPALDNNASVTTLEVKASNAVNLNGKTLRVSGAVTQEGTITASPSGSLILNGAGAVAFGGAGSTAVGLLQVGEGGALPSVTLSGAAGNVTAAEGIDLLAGATLDATGRALTVGGDLKLNGTATLTGTTIAMNGSAAQTIFPGSNTFNHLTISNSSLSGVGVRTDGATEAATLNLNGTLTLNALARFSAQSDTFTLKGDWSQSATAVFVNTGSTVEFNHATLDQSVSATGFNILRIAKSSTSLTATGTVTVAGTLTVSSGTFHWGTGLGGHQVTGATSISGTLDLGTSTVQLIGPVTVNAGGRLQLVGLCTLRLGAAGTPGSVTVNTGSPKGRFRALSQGGDSPTVTSADTATPTFYSFTVNGEFEVTGMNFTYCNQSGLRINNASDASVLNLSRISFANGQKGGSLGPVGLFDWFNGVFLHINTNAPDVFSAGLISNTFGAPFADDGNDRMVNIKVTEAIGSAVTMQMTGSGGVGAGESFDQDDANDAGEEVTWITTTTWRSNPIIFPTHNTRWNNAANWTNGAPNGALDVIVDTSAGATSWPKLEASDGPFDCVSISLGAGATLDLNGQTLLVSGTLTFNAASTLIVANGAVKLDGDGDQAIDTVAKPLWDFIIDQSKPGASVISLSSDLVINGTATFTQGKLDVGSRTLFIDGDFDLSAVNFTFQQTQPARVEMTGGNPATIKSKAGQFLHHLRINKNPGVLVSAQSDLDVNGNVELVSGRYDPSPGGNSYLLTVGGNWSETSGFTFQPTAGTIRFDGAAPGAPQTISSLGTNWFHHLEVGSGGNGLSPGNNLAINGNLSILAGGILNGGTRTYTIAGGWSRNATGTFNAGTSTAVFSGVVTIPGETFYNLTVTGDVTASGGLTLLNAFTLNGTRFRPSIGGANLTHTVQGNWTETAGTFGPTEGTCQFTGSAAQVLSVSGSNAFFNLTINKSASTLNMVSAGMNLDANNNFTLTSGTFNSNANLGTLRVGGAWSRSGTFTLGTSTVSFDGTADQSIPSESFYRLDVNKPSGTATATGALTVTNGLTVTAGTLNLGAGLTHNVDAVAGNVVDVTGTLDLGTSALRPDGNVLVQAAGILSMSGTASARPQLQMAANRLLSVSGTLRTAKVDSAFRPLITSQNPGTDRYDFLIGGTVDVSGLVVESPHGGGGTRNGMEWGTAGTVTQLNDINFSQVIAGAAARCLNMLMTPGATTTINIVEVRFPDDASRTVAKASTSNLTINVAGYSPKSGANAAPTREVDPDARIVWVGDNFWTGTAPPGQQNRWGTPANWSTGAVPNALQNAIIESGKPAYPILSADTANPNIFSLEMRGGSLTIDRAAATFTVASNLTITGGAVTMTNSTLRVGGTWARSGGTFTHTTAGTVQFNQPGARLDSTDTFYNLTFSGAGSGVSLSATADATVTNTLTISGILNASSGTLRTPTWNKTGTFNAQTGTVVFRGTLAMPNEVFYNLTVDGTAVTVSVAGGVTRTVQNHLTIGADDTLSMGAGSSLVVGGDWTRNGTFTPSTSTVTLNGGGLQQVSAANFHNLTVSNGSAAGVVTNGNQDINGALTISSGAKIDGTGDTWNVAGNWDSQSGTYVSGNGSNVIFDGASIVLPGPSTFRDVTVTGAVTLQSGYTWDIDGNLASSGAFTMSSATVRLGGNLTQSGTWVTDSSNFFFDGTVAQTSVAAPFNNVTITGTGTNVSISPSGTWDLAGALLLDAGATLNASGDTVQVEYNATLSGTLTTDSASVLTLDGGANDGVLAVGANRLNHLNIFKTGSKKVELKTAAGGSATTNALDGNLSIGAGAILEAADDTITVKGNWSNSGTFANSNSTVSMNGAAAQSIQATGFNILKIENTSTTALVSAVGNLTAATLDVADGTFNLGTGLTHSISGLTFVGTVSAGDGALDLGTSTLTGGGDLTVRALGSLKLFATAGAAPTLRMASSTTVRVAGALETQMSGANIPRLTSTNVGGDRFGFEVTGTVRLAGLTFESFNADGLKILSGATVLDIDDVAFLSPPNPAVQLNLPFTSAFAASPAAFSFTGCTFQAVVGPPSTTNANVSIGANTNAGVTVQINLYDSLGAGGTPPATAETMDVDDVTAPGLVTVDWRARNRWTNGTANGLWGTAGNWSLGDVPDPTDNPRWEVLVSNVYAAVGPTINVNAATNGITITNLTVTEGAGGAFSLNVAGDFTVTGTGGFSPGDGTVTLDGSGVQVVNPNAQSFNHLTIANAAADGIEVLLNAGIDVNGTFTLTDGQVDPNGLTHRFAGNWSETVAAGVWFRDLTGTVIFDGAGGATISPSPTSYFNHVQINKSLAAATVTAGANWLLMGNFDLTQGIFSPGGFTLDLKGNWDDEDGASTTFTAPNGTVKFSGVNQTLKTGASHYFRHVTLASTGTLSIDAASGAPDLNNGNFTIVSGTFNPGAFTVEVGGNWDDAGGTFTGGTGTVLLDGPALAAQTITSGASNRFNHLTVNTGGGISGSVTALSALNVDGNLTHQFGTFDPGSFTHAVAGAWDTSAAGASFVATAGKITFDGGSSTIKVKAADRFYDFSINTSGTKSMAAGSVGLDVDRDFALDGGTFDAGSLTHNVGRNYTSPGTLTPAASTFRFDGAAAQSIGAETFNNLTIANTSASDKVSLAGAVGAAVTTVSVGTLRIDGVQLSQSDSLTVAAGARLELNGGAVVQVASAKTVSISGTLATTGSTPTFTSPSPGSQFYRFVARAGATLDLQGAVIRSANTPVDVTHAGTTDAAVSQAAVVIAVDPAGAPDTVFANLADVQIQTCSADAAPAPRNAGIWIGTPPSGRTVNFTRASFDATCTVNVRSFSGSDLVNLEESTGANQGESFDLDFDETDPSPTIRTNVNWLRNLSWTGAVNTDWNNGNNWNPNISPGSPTAGDVCTIPTGAPNNPILNTAVTYLAFSVTIQNGESITLNNAGATFDLTGRLTMGASAVLTHTTGTLKIGGNFDNGSGGTYTHTAGTIEFDGTGPQTVNPGAGALRTVVISNSTGSITAATNLDIDGALTIGAGGNLNISGRTMNIAASIGGAGTLTGDNNSLVVFDSGSAITTLPFTLGSVQITVTGTALTITPDGTLDVNNLTISSGTSLGIANDTLRIGGALTNGGTFNPDTAGSRVVFDGSGAQTINGLAYNRLQIDKGYSSTATLGFNTSTSDAATVMGLTAGRLDLNGYTLTVAGGLDAAAGTELIMRGTSRLLVGASKTVNLDGTFTASITGSDKPEITRSGAGTWTCTIDGPFDVNGLKVSYYDASGVQITPTAGGNRFEDVDFTNAVAGGRHLSLTHAGPIAIDAPSCFFDSSFTLGVGVNVRGEDSNGTGGDVSILLEDRDAVENGPGRGEANDADVSGGNVEWLRADTPLGGPVIGGVFAAYDLNTGIQIAVYIVARDAGPLGRDRVYVVDANGEPNPLYDGDPDMAGNQPYLEIVGDVIGPVWWNTEGATNVLYFGTSAGLVYRAVNNTTAKTLTVSAGFPFNAGSPITGPVISDGTYIYVPIDAGASTGKVLAVTVSSPLEAYRTSALGGVIRGMMELEDGGFNPFAPPGFTVYAGTEAPANLVRIDGTAGLPVQMVAASASVLAPPTVTTERMAVGDLGGNLYRVTVDPFTLDSGWPYAASGAIRGGALRDTFGGYPAGANASGLRIYFGDDTGRLYCVASAWPAPGPVAVDPDGAGPVGAYPLLLPDTAPCRSFPQYWFGVVYIANENGKVFVVDESERTVIKTYFFGAGVKLGDIGWDNNAAQYTVGGDNGRLYYFPETADPTP